jgi:hypothetical protein
MRAFREGHPRPGTRANATTKGFALRSRTINIIMKPLQPFLLLLALLAGWPGSFSLMAQATAAAPDLEPNILLYTGHVEAGATLALKAIQDRDYDLTPEVAELKEKTTQTMTVLRTAFEERGEELPPSPVLAERHAGFVAAQSVYEQQYLGLLSRLAEAGSGDRENRARALLTWVAEELRRNGIDLENPLRPVAPKVLKQPRGPADQGSRVRPAFMQTYLPPDPIDSQPDPMWAAGWSNVQSEARKLGNAKAIIEFVQNQIALEPGFGFQHHPLTTLQRKTGSDFDQAALLVALLRAADTPARFIYFAASTDRRGAERIWGASDLAQAGEITAAEGRPAVLVKTQREGPPVQLRMEHIAVQYFDSQARRWQLVDPAYGYATQSLRIAIPASPAPLTDPLSTPWDELEEEDQQEWISALEKGDFPKPSPAPRDMRLADGEDSIYSPLAWLAEFSVIPEKLALRISLELRTAEGVSRVGPLPLPAVYPPFISIDAVDADAPQKPPAESPPNDLAQYLVRLHPRWIIPGREPMIVNQLACRSTLPWEIAVTIDRPLLDPQSRRRNLKAGGKMALSWGPLPRSGYHDALSAAGAGYLSALDLFDQAIAEQTCVVGVPEPPLLIASAAEPIFLQPLDGFGERGMQVSVDQFWHARTPVHLKPLADGDRYILASGMVASGLEHRILEKTFQSQAVSTVSIASECATRESARIVPFNAPSQFGINCFPGSPIKQWSGTAELVLEMPSFAGRYDLTGGLRGGIVTKLLPRSSGRLPFAELPMSEHLIAPPPDRLMPVLSSSMAGLKSPILTRKPTPLICACWTAEWFLDQWLPWTPPATSAGQP